MAGENDIVGENVEAELEDILEVGKDCLVLDEVDDNSALVEREDLYDLPCLRKSEDRLQFLVETKTDPSLKTCSEVAQKAAYGKMVCLYSPLVMRYLAI